MRVLTKRKRASYWSANGVGSEVLAYDGEVSFAIAEPDNTRYVAPTPSKPLIPDIPDDFVHDMATTAIGVATIVEAGRGAAAGMAAGGPGVLIGGAYGALQGFSISAIAACAICHSVRSVPGDTTGTGDDDMRGGS